MQLEEKTIHLRDGAVCVLRSPGPRDAEELLAYLRLTSAETPFMIRFPAEVTMTVPQETEYLIRTLCAPGAVMISAVVDGALAGNCGVNPVLERQKTAHRASFGLAVKQAYWGRGIGGLLLDEAVRAAAELGYGQLELDVFGRNERAQRLYASRGFAVCGRIPRAFRLGEGEYDDAVLMVKMLR